MNGSQHDSIAGLAECVSSSAVDGRAAEGVCVSEGGKASSSTQQTSHEEAAQHTQHAQHDTAQPLHSTAQHTQRQPFGVSSSTVMHQSGSCKEMAAVDASRLLAAAKAAGVFYLIF